MIDSKQIKFGIKNWYFQQNIDVQLQHWFGQIITYKLISQLDSNTLKRCQFPTISNHKNCSFILCKILLILIQSRTNIKHAVLHLINLFCISEIVCTKFWLSFMKNVWIKNKQVKQPIKLIQNNWQYKHKASTLL